MGAVTAFSYTALLGWTPGFYDRTPSGYIITASYIVAVALCVKLLLQRSPTRLQGGERRYWIALLCLYTAMGLNKQLDLQTPFFELVHRVLHRMQWSNERQLAGALLLVIALFIVGLLVAGLLVGKLLVARKADRVGRLALAALALLVAFFVLRAAMQSRFIESYSTLWNLLHLHRLLEFGSVCLVAAAAWERLRECRK